MDVAVYPVVSCVQLRSTCVSMQCCNNTPQQVCLQTPSLATQEATPHYTEAYGEPSKASRDFARDICEVCVLKVGAF